MFQKSQYKSTETYIGSFEFPTVRTRPMPLYSNGPIPQSLVFSMMCFSSASERSDSFCAAMRWPRWVWLQIIMRTVIQSVHYLGTHLHSQTRQRWHNWPQWLFLSLVQSRLRITCGKVINKKNLISLHINVQLTTTQSLICIRIGAWLTRTWMKNSEASFKPCERKYTYRCEHKNKQRADHHA